MQTVAKAQLAADLAQERILFNNKVSVTNGELMARTKHRISFC